MVRDRAVLELGLRSLLVLGTGLLLKLATGLGLVRFRVWKRVRVRDRV